MEFRAILLQQEQVHEVGDQPAEEGQDRQDQHHRHAGQAKPGHHAGHHVGFGRVAVGGQPAIDRVEIDDARGRQQPVHRAEREQHAVDQRRKGQGGVQELGHGGSPGSALARGRRDALAGAVQHGLCGIGGILHALPLAGGAA